MSLTAIETGVTAETGKRQYPFNRPYCRLSVYGKQLYLSRNAAVRLAKVLNKFVDACDQTNDEDKS